MAFGRKSANFNFPAVQNRIILGLDSLPGKELSAGSSNLAVFTNVIWSCESYSIHRPPALMPASCAHKTAATESSMTPAKNAFTGNLEFVFNPVVIFGLLLSTALKLGPNGPNAKRLGK